MCEAAARDINVKLSELLKLSSMYKERGRGVASTSSISPASGVACNLRSRLNGLRTIYLLAATGWSGSIHESSSKEQLSVQGGYPLRIEISPATAP